jgi:hypothetical protein
MQVSGLPGTMIINPTMPLTLDTGTLQVDNVAPLPGTGGAPPIMGVNAPGFGIITGSLENLGTVDFMGNANPSALTVGANYSQVDAEGEPSASPGTLDMRLFGGGVSDTLSVGGVAALAGVLNVTGVPGPATLLPVVGAFAVDQNGNPYDFADITLPANCQYLGLGVIGFFP